jgi:putative membrane protein
MQTHDGQGRSRDDQGRRNAFGDAVLCGAGERIQQNEATMRRTIFTLALLLPLAACGSSDEGYGSSNPPTSSSGAYGSPSGSTYGSTYGSSSSATGQTSQPTARPPAGTAGMGAATGAMQLSAAEQAFMMDAAQGGMAEVELGRLAQQRGSSAQVRDFGRMMVQQHSQANSELMAIAQRLGVTLPSTLPPSAQAAQMRLQQTQGPDFDKQYIELQAAGHLEQRALFQFAANNAQNPELRSFAQKTLPMIERHIDQLHTIEPVAMRTSS